MEDNKLVLFERQYLSAFKALSDLKKEQARLAEFEKSTRAEIEEGMAEYGICAIKNEYVNITTVAGSETTTIDLKALEKKEPALYQELLEDYPKVTKRKAAIRIEVK